MRAASSPSMADKSSWWMRTLFLFEPAPETITTLLLSTLSALASSSMHCLFAAPSGGFSAPRRAPPQWPLASLGTGPQSRNSPPRRHGEWESRSLALGLFIDGEDVRATGRSDIGYIDIEALRLTL